MFGTSRAVGRRLRTAAEIVRAHPALLVAGTATTTLLVGAVAAVVVGHDVAGGVAFDAFAEPTPDDRRDVPATAELQATLLHWLLTGVVAAAVYLFVRATVTAPVAAAVDRTLLGEDPVGAVVGSWPRTAFVALAHGVTRLALWLLLTLVAVAVYLSAGTAVEVVSYALGLYEAVPWLATLLALATAGLAGVVGTTALSWSPAAVGRVDEADPVGLRTGLRRARERPWHALGDAVAVTLLAATPLLAGLLAVGAAHAVGVEGDTVTLLWGGAAAVLVGTVTGAVAGAYRDVALGRVDVTDRPGTPTAPAGDADRSVPVRRVLVAVALVATAGVVGAGVRAADLHPAAAGDDPGPVVESDPPDTVVEAAVASVAGRSRTVEVRRYSRVRYFENGTVTPWRRSVFVHVRLDPGDRQALVYGADDASDGRNVRAVYASSVVTARAVIRVSGGPSEGDADYAARASQVLAESDSQTRRLTSPPETLGDDGTGGTLGESLYRSHVADETWEGWTLVDRTDGRLVYESTTDRSVAAVADVGTASEHDLRYARVAVDADTGRVVSAEAVFGLAPYDDASRVTEFRRTYETEAVDATDVTRPAAVDRGPLAVLVDAVFY